MEAIGGAADAIVETARADRHAAGDANARRERASVLEVNDRFWDQAEWIFRLRSLRARSAAVGILPSPVWIVAPSGMKRAIPLRRSPRDGVVRRSALAEKS